MLKIIALILSFNFLNLVWTACYRKPQGATGDRSPVDENYQILIEGNPATYIPGQQYNISLSCASGLKFISFTLLVEAEASNTFLGSSAFGANEMLGRFEIIDNAETKFSTLCENMIESSNTNAKNRIDVAWIAPSDGQSGCVLFKAAILQHRNVWFIDDGFLTKRLCPEEIDEINSQTPPVNPCCACDEAKYEIILERKWMRNTHAKDFPSEAWRTRLGEVIGASHSLDFRFWEYGGRASQGLQELAEHGATKTLENEIKEHTRGTGNIRTIIKAPGIIYRPNVVGKTLATVRVGPNHHVISLVTKIDPSPDWILGVAGLELCLANCTWIEKKVLNLYPWDVGTDAGPSYMSPDQAQYPADVIRRITSTFPSDYRSPFFNENGAPMKPLATLHVTRKRTYERECDFEDFGPMECSTHPWSAWTECNAKCGAGTQYRTRSYKDAKVAENFNCKVVLRQNQNCIGMKCGVQQPDLTGAECELTTWSTWTECSKKCGKGFQTRSRDYTNPYAKEKCQAGVAVELLQTRTCNGENCGGNIYTSTYEGNSNDMFQTNYEPEEQEPNLFQNTKFKKKPFNKGFEGPFWNNRNEEEEEEPSNFDTNSNFDSNEFQTLSKKPASTYENAEQKELNVNNIYGQEKLVGKVRRPFKGVQNQNIFGDVETSFNDNKRLQGNRSKQQFATSLRPTEKYDVQSFIPSSDRSDTSNNFNRNFQPYGFKTIDAEQENFNFCLQKPFGSHEKCNKKRIIVRNYWFYDAEDGECKLFTADNCDENKNKFFSMEKCLETCSQIAKDQQKLIPNTRQGYSNTSYRSRWN